MLQPSVLGKDWVRNRRFNGTKGLFKGLYGQKFRIRGLSKWPGYNRFETFCKTPKIPPRGKVGKQTREFSPKETFFRKKFPAGNKAPKEFWTHGPLAARNLFGQMGAPRELTCDKKKHTRFSRPPGEYKRGARRAFFRRRHPPL